VKFLAGNVLSFVYADYGVKKRVFLDNLNGTKTECGFRGYHSIWQQEVFRPDIVPPGWIPSLRPTREKDIQRLRQQGSCCEPFGHWSIWRRDEDKHDDYGPDLFSFLYFAGEMSAIYQGLYCRLRVAPLVLAIIQPGALGGEWEMVDADDSFFKEVVCSNPAGMPEYLLYGGLGERGSYAEPCWHEYRGKRVVQLPERYAGLWKRNSGGEHIGSASHLVNEQPQLPEKPASPPDPGPPAGTPAQPAPRKKLDDPLRPSRRPGFQPRPKGGPLLPLDVPSFLKRQAEEDKG
jgi:hypothetical protein